MQTTRKLYQIYTEDKNRINTENLVGDKFKSFSVIEATGFYNYEKEKAIVIEIIGECTVTHSEDELRFELENVRRVAQQIKEHNEQECVLLTISTIKVEEV